MIPVKAPVRIVSCNLLEGLRPVAPAAANERRHLDRERSAAARTVVAELYPDILVLNEALFCQQYIGRIMDYARLFNFPLPGRRALRRGLGQRS